MNDVLLPREHGAPVRAIVPNHYGFKNVKWLTEVEVIAGPPDQGYWEKQAGWNSSSARSCSCRAWTPSTCRR